MKKSKILMLVLGALACASMMAFTACNKDTDDNTLDPNEYVFEAEGCDLTGLAGHGYSDEGREEGMIRGENTKAIRNNSTVLNSLSNEHFVAYYNTAGTTLTFKINASAAATDNTMKLRLGSEYGTLRIDPSALEIKVNGVALNYSKITVTGNAINNPAEDIGYKSAFKDYAISEKFDLKEGENIITLTLLENELGAGLSTAALLCVGPGVDCIKIKSDATLSWESMWNDNKENIPYED